MNDLNSNIESNSLDVITDPITFEVPLNQRSRSLLRLERLFRETNQQIKLDSSSAHFFALKQIFLLIDFCERGDYKSELIKDLDREIAYFAKLIPNPEVDIGKLDIFISQLEQLSSWFKGQQGKIGHQLLKQEFLANARQKLTLGTMRLSFDAPYVKLFLSMSAESRRDKLYSWLNAFKGIQTSVEVLLRLSRETGSYNSVKSEYGFYHGEMEKNEYQFIGIQLASKMMVYPEVSSGTKRFSIRFMALDDALKAEQYSEEFKFNLAKYT